MTASGRDRLRIAMDRYRRSLLDLEDFLLAGRGLPDIELAAAHRLILGIDKWVKDRFFLGADPTRPRFIKFMDEFSQWGLGNPDNLYFSAQVDASHAYVVRGDRGSCADICIELRTGNGRLESGEHSRTLGAIDAGALHVDDQGRFAVQIGGEARHPDYIANQPGADMVFVRRTFDDWEQERGGELWIECVGGPAEPSPPPGSDEVAAKIEAVARRLAWITRINHEQVAEFRTPLLVNAFPPAPADGGPALKTKSSSGFFPGQKNALAWWDLKPGKALIITFDVPQCRYFGLMIGHPLWFSALDFENRQNSLSGAQAHRSSDGRVRYVLAAQDPLVANWIDPGHLREGFLFLRCQGVTGAFSAPAVAEVDAADIAAFLPPDTPRIDAAARAEALHRRRIAVQRRSL